MLEWCRHCGRRRWRRHCIFGSPFNRRRGVRVDNINIAASSTGTYTYVSVLYVWQGGIHVALTMFEFHLLGFIARQIRIVKLDVISDVQNSFNEMVSFVFRSFCDLYTSGAASIFQNELCTPTSCRVVDVKDNHYSVCRTVLRTMQNVDTKYYFSSPLYMSCFASIF